MKKILVVDDEKELRELMVEKLLKNNYAVSSAGDGKEALRVAVNEQPDLILLDVAMPIMDGYETCQELKKNIKTKEIPVVFLTGKDLDPQSINRRNNELGACGFLPKPSTFKELLDTITEILG
ncbi:MAG: response regulator [Candidatus Omnitrophota bacterium]|jgi:CheY-like chemotaxis protein